MSSFRVVYGPDWPDPVDVPSFLEQCAQLARASLADEARPFKPVRAIVILLDDRDGRYSMADIVHDMPNADAIAALKVSARRFARALDPLGEFDPEE